MNNSRLLKLIASILGVIIVVLLGILIFIPGVKSPAGPSNATSTPNVPQPIISPDGHVEVSAPLADQTIKSPVVITGNVTGGGWFFEASFPIKIVDANGAVLGQGIAQANADWMSTGTVPFSAVINFKASKTATGTIVLSKDNPSGLPEHDMSFSVPIRFATSTKGGVVATTTPVVFKNDAGAKGMVLMGPTCPVEKNPPDPACAPKPYVTNISVYPKNSTTAIAMAATDPWGDYLVVVPPGDYLFVPKSGNTFPRCASTQVAVVAHAFTKIDLNCDTGIR